MSVFTLSSMRQFFTMVAESSQRLRQNTIIRWTMYGAIFSSFIGIILILVSFHSFPPVVPLWYSRPWGLDRLTSPYWLFILPLSSLLWNTINSLLSASLIAEYLVFSQILSIGSFVISVMSLITLIKIILIIT